MWLRGLCAVVVTWLCLGCEGNVQLTTMSDSAINQILAQVDTEDPEFVQKGVSFDSIITIAGHRYLKGKKARVKCKLFFYRDYVRGYYNLTEQDDKNLQIFGKKTEDYLIFRSATKINMEEADGYIIFDKGYNGIWSNGNVNFEKGTIELVKNDTDYNTLQQW